MLTCKILVRVQRNAYPGSRKWCVCQRATNYSACWSSARIFLGKWSGFSRVTYHHENINRRRYSRKNEQRLNELLTTIKRSYIDSRYRRTPQFINLTETIRRIEFPSEVSEIVNNLITIAAHICAVQKTNISDATETRRAWELSKNNLETCKRRINGCFASTFKSFWKLSG